MKWESVRLFAISKLDWIKRQQTKIRSQEREPEREFHDRESRYPWGKRYLLSTVERDARPTVRPRRDKLEMAVQPGASVEARGAILEAWYREQVRQAVPDLLAKWQPEIGVEVKRFFVRRMRTKWGSCTPTSRSIRLNTDLAKKPRECLEYIVVHELLHLLEPTHNARFVALMNRFLPTWKHARDVLNRLPVRHIEWDY